MTADESHHLFARYLRGDEAAAQQIFERYLARRIGLARQRISPKLARRIDAEDVVQSAYGSFFRLADADQVRLHSTGDLWRLQAAITVNKTRQQVERHTSGKRSLDAEQSVHARSGAWEARFAADDPSPDEAAAIIEELERAMADLSPLHRQMLQLSLQGAAVSEISLSTQRSEHQVRRVLKKVKDSLEARLLETTPQAASESCGPSEACGPGEIA